MEKKNISLNFIVLSFAVLAFAAFVSGCGTAPVKDVEPETEEEIIEKITAEAEQGNMEKALELFEGRKESDPILYAILLINNGKFDEAESILDTIIRQDEANITALYYSSLVHNIRGDRVKEKERLEAVLALDPGNADANISLGRLYASEKKYREAEERFKKVISAVQYSEDAELGYAMVLLAQGKTGEALNHYDNVIANSRNMSAYIDRAYIKSVREDYRGAEADLDEAIKIDPGYVWNYMDRGRARLYSGNFTGAAEDFTKVIEYDSSVFIAYVHRAQSYEGEGKDDLALNDYREALSRNTGYARGYVPLALQLFRVREWGESARYFLKAYERDKSPEFLLLAAAALVSAGDRAKAAKLITDNMNSTPRENILYHISRLYIDPKYEGIVIQKMGEEKQVVEKIKGKFYLAVYYDTFGKNNLSERYYTEIVDEGFPETLEYRLASWKLSDKG